MAKKAELKPLVVFVFSSNRGPTSTRFGGFISRLKKGGALDDLNARVVALEDLEFSVLSATKALIIDRQTGLPAFDDASLVYFKSWESMPEPAGAVARYLSAKGIPYFDETVGEAGVSKLTQTFKLWASGLSVVPTIGSSVLPSQERIKQVCGSGPWIVKVIHGQKGKDNYLVKSYDQMPKYFNGETWQLIQPFIANKGDFRILVYGGQVRGALWRKAVKGSHLNNTSAGATSSWLEPSELSADIRKLARRAAIATNHQIAGVDVIVDKATSKPYLLEVNQGAQVVTGGHIDKKVNAFGSFLKKTVQQRHARSDQKRLRPIGRTANISMPEIGLFDIMSKVDTGAYKSALHARDIQEFSKPDGSKWVRFTVDDAHDKYGASHPIIAEAAYVDKVRVRSSNSQHEQRYVVNVAVSVGGNLYHTEMTLTDRSDMKLPVLLGRRFLRGRFAVNIELGSKGLRK